MKRLLSKVPVTKFLIPLFVVFLILIFISESVEYKRLQHGHSTINELTSKSIRRQQILASMQKGSDNIHVNILSFLLYQDNGKRLLAENKINEEVLKNGQNQLEYQKLIQGPSEQQLFNRVQSFRKLNIESQEKIIRLIKRDKYQAALNIGQNKLLKLYEDSR